MINNTLTIGICNYNTTELTNEAVHSLITHLPPDLPWKVLILDNSDCEPFQLRNINAQLITSNRTIQILDNMNGKYIDCNRVVEEFCRIPITHSNNGSLKHCFCIQWLLNSCITRDFLLCDSDIVVNSDIDFILPQYITCGHVQYSLQPNEKSGKSFGKPYLGKTRFLPYIQYFNCEKLRINNISYFNPCFIHGGLTQNGNTYDTGAYFYEQIYSKKLNYLEFDYHQYITHFGAESWKKFDVLHKYTN